MINCAAWTDVDGAESREAEATAVNGDGVGELARRCADAGSVLVHYSTDYVFDGAAPPYKPGDKPSPVNAYGQLKLEGEGCVLEAGEGNMVLRVPVLYGPVEYLGESAVTALLQTVTSKKPAKVSDYEIRRPAHVGDVAKIAAQLLAKKAELGATVSGVYQWSGREALTKFGMVRAMAAAFKLDIEHVEANAEKPPDDAKTRRPHDCTMDTSRLEELGIAEHVEFARGIKEVLGKWVTEK